MTPPRRCPTCCAIERRAGSGVYLCGYRDDGWGRCADLTRVAIAVVGWQHVQDYQDPHYERKDTSCRR